MKKPVKSFMTKKVIAVKESESIKKLFKLMDKHDILGVPVINDKKEIIGIVTESDLINHFTTLKSPRGINLLGSIVYLDDINKFNENLKDHCAETVKDIMTKGVKTANTDTTLLEAINLMSKNKITRLPVVNKSKKLIGIITRSDIVHQIAKLKRP
ncbi:CBS domain-containing protein [Candidatus Peregrinibacteria bacterium]|nr:CBS domain-containing protein [Candidatus Peregrinibacteria bacterium]